MKASLKTEKCYWKYWIGHLSPKFYRNSEVFASVVRERNIEEMFISTTCDILSITGLNPPVLHTKLSVRKDLIS